ncbi:sodium:proton antiporter [Brevibacillus humidisoli]|uniref:Na+/H+ antiporter NhaC family protein n=1 Tax=Brevibacillus humidisoli TaxID=2895522 RepID=UPI001E492C5F|nr:Na+/H+ antiporter NhaC family protein [Brevibacillus humidisoli]UFJ39952.1 sodium:proton antiporter [Brevibacillus humidisoli]
MFLANLPVLTLIGSIAACLIGGLPLSLALATALLVTLLTVKRLGCSYRQQWQYGWAGLKQTKPVLIILFLVGLLIPLLMMAGTIPAMISYGLSLVHVQFLLTISFGLTAAVSYLLGSSVGTLSTVGLSLIGIAHASGIPSGLAAGALISGAMVGERFSPVSSSRLLVLSTVQEDEARGRFWQITGVCAVGITALMFLVADLGREAASASETIAGYQQLLQQHVPISWVQLLPLIILLGSFAFRVKAIPALCCGLAASFLLYMVTQSPDWHSFLENLLFGYDLRSGTILDALLHGGGLLDILHVLLLISLAGFMNGILYSANLLEPILERFVGSVNNAGVLVAKCVALSLFAIAISCNQTIPILVLGATLRSRFMRLPDGSQLLGRTMLDATLVMPVLVPWNGLAMVTSLAIGVTTLEALPYLWFPLLLPIVTILFSWFHRRQSASEWAKRTEQAL